MKRLERLERLERSDPHAEPSACPERSEVKSKGQQLNSLKRLERLERQELMKRLELLERLEPGRWMCGEAQWNDWNRVARGGCGAAPESKRSKTTWGGR